MKSFMPPKPQKTPPPWGDDADLEADPPVEAPLPYRTAVRPRPPPAPVSGPGSWANPRVRKDGIATRTTTVHLPLDVAARLDEVRIRTHRRLADILTEAAREWLRRHA